MESGDQARWVCPMTSDNIAQETNEQSPIGTAIFGLMLVVLGGAVLYFSKDIRAFALGESDPGPKALPLICGGLFIIGGLAQLGQAIFFDKLFKTPNAGANPFSSRFAATLGMLIGYVALLNSLGYLLATSLFMLSILKLFRSRWPEAVIASIVLVSFVYLLFEIVFKVSLPKGMFF